jgi:DNA replication protein DnaC
MDQYHHCSPRQTRTGTFDFAVRGREDELSRLAKLIKNPRGRFAVVCGPGGTGKSSVAELAERTNATEITWFLVA